MSLVSPTPLTTALVDTSAKRPPELPLNVRARIPQPHIFCTKQDIQGNIISLDTDSHLSGQLRASSQMRELIEKCIRSFTEPRQNGNSLRQLLLEQVLSEGQAKSPAYKFLLTDGTSVTAQTTSKLMRPKQNGEPQVISSYHVIYRDGTLQGLDSQTLPAYMRSIVSGPVVTETPQLSRHAISTAITTVTPTTSTTDYFLTSSHQSIAKIVSTSAITCAGNRPRSSADCQSTKSMDATQQVLAGTDVYCNRKMGNKGMSPSTHFKGPLVHTGGGRHASTQVNGLTPTASNNFMQREVQPRKVSSGFIPPPVTDVSVPVSPVRQIFVSGITTMRKEPTVTTTLCNLPARYKINNCGRVSDTSTPFSSEGVCTLETNSSAYQPNSNHPRRTPTHANSSPGESPRKRSSSTLSQDSCSKEVAIKSPRKVKKDSKSGTNLEQNKLLRQLLKPTTDTDVEQPVLSKSLGSTTKDSLTDPQMSKFSSDPTPATFAQKSKCTVSTSGTPQRSTVQLPSLSMQSEVLADMNFDTSVSTTSNPFLSSASCTNLPQGDSTLFDKMFNSPGSPLVASHSQSLSCQRFSISTAVSQEELEELNDILDSINDDNVFSSNCASGFSHHQMQLSSGIGDKDASNTLEVSLKQNNTFENLHGPNQNHSIQSNNNISGFNGNDGLSLRNSNQSHVITLPNQTTLQSSLSPLKQMTLPNLMEDPVFANVVPTKQDVCPNRVVDSVGMTSSHLQQTHFTSRNREYPAMENWEGNKPLVNLEMISPSIDVTLPMTNQVPSGMSSSVSGGNVMKIRPSNLMQTYMQNDSTSRMTFPTSRSRFTNNNQIEARNVTQQQNGNLKDMNGVVPNSYSCGVSPQRNLSNNLQPMYHNQQLQPGLLSNNPNPSFLRQQSCYSGFNSEMETSSGEIPCYNHSMGTRMLSPRSSDLKMNQRRLPNQSTNTQQHNMASLSGQNAYSSLGTHRFMSGRATANNFSPAKSPGCFSNSLSPFHAGMQPSIPFNCAVHPDNIVVTGLMGYNGSNRGIYNRSISLNASMQQLGSNDVTGSNTGVKSDTKRSRICKTRKNTKTKSTETASWNGITSSAYNRQDPALQNAVGDPRQTTSLINQRNGLQPLMPSRGSVTSQNSGSVPQSCDLNSFLNQQPIKLQPVKFNFDNITNSSPIRDVPNSFHTTPTSSLEWSRSNSIKGDDVTGTMSSDFWTRGISNNIGGDVCTKANSFASSVNVQGKATSNAGNTFFPVTGSSHNNVTMNTNLNNNNKNCETSRRLSGSVTSEPLHSPRDVVTSTTRAMTSKKLPVRRNSHRESIHLRTLLLSND